MTEKNRLNSADFSLVMEIPSAETSQKHQFNFDAGRVVLSDDIGPANEIPARLPHARRDISVLHRILSYVDWGTGRPGPLRPGYARDVVLVETSREC